MIHEDSNAIKATWVVHFDITTRVRIRKAWHKRRDGVADISRTEPPDRAIDFSIAVHQGEILGIRNWQNPCPQIFANDCR